MFNYFNNNYFKNNELLSGETQTYYWYINKNTGPTAEQEECSVSAYYSTVDVVKVQQYSPNMYNEQCSKFITTLTHTHTATVLSHTGFIQRSDWPTGDLSEQLGQVSAFTSMA